MGRETGMEGRTNNGGQWEGLLRVDRLGIGSILH
jgi:hypothetical protein